MKRRIPILTALLLAPLAALDAADLSAKRPNILFIITDQQSADAMSCRMGKQFINTPAMDRLAQTGVLFTRAYSSNPLCMPYRNSVFTGLYPHQTGVTKNARPKDGFDPTTFVGGTGAGDAFDAGYIAGLLWGADPAGCLRWGAALGASCVRSIGATESVFNRAEAEAFMREHELPIDVL